MKRIFVFFLALLALAPAVFAEEGAYRLLYESAIAGEILPCG